MLCPDLPERVAEVRDRINAAVARGARGQAVRIIAVTKTYPAAVVEEAWRAGLTDVGENRVQEALDKMSQVSVPVAWHLIGHVQRNKVKQVRRFRLTHSVDSCRLADAIGQDGISTGGVHSVLLQVNTSGEVSKGGYTLEEVAREAERLRAMGGLRVRGAMTMAPLDADESTLRRTFAGAREALARLRVAGHDATELSMGMSNDYEIAVEEGATMVRLGTILFGARTA